jgi:hypothetical protein
MTPALSCGLDTATGSIVRCPSEVERGAREILHFRVVVFQRFPAGVVFGAGGAFV